MNHSQPIKVLQQLFREKWPEYVVEIIVIILGITISFALDEWQEQSRKSELAQVYLKSLHSDLTQDIRNLQATIQETQLVIKQAQLLLLQAEHASGSDPVTIEPAQFFTALKDVVRRPLFIAHDATFSDLKSSGNMQLIKDFPLKNALFGYYLDYESIRQKEIAEREATINLTAPYLMKHVPLRFLSDTHQPNLKNVSFIPLLKDTEFSNNVFIRLANRQELLADYQESLALSRQMKSRLEKQLR